MKRIEIKDSKNMVLILQDEIRRNSESRYNHRLHAVLLVAQGMSCRQVANKLGDGARTVAYWLRRFEEEGLSGLADGEKLGRPKRLNESQLEKVETALRGFPEEVGMDANLWDGKVLSAYMKQEWGINLGIRQCQRLFRQLGFRLRKPRSKIASADPEKQVGFKKKLRH